MKTFNEFITQAELIDLPMARRKFTWYRDNGSSCSRLDRFLLSDEWMKKWPELIQVGIKRRLSDHAAIVLKGGSQDWGPTPFRFVNSWTREKDFMKVVEEEWNKGLEGWGAFVMKEKMKNVKMKLKEWSSRKVENIDGKIESVSVQVEKADLELENYNGEQHNGRDWAEQNGRNNADNLIGPNLSNGGPADSGNVQEEDTLQPDSEQSQRTYWNYADSEPPRLTLTEGNLSELIQ